MYERLCRGEHTHDYKDKHKLVCRYKTNNDPLLLINPAKEEEIYLDPYLVAYHNVISDYELAVIKSIATPKLGRATVHNAKTGKLEFAHYRVSKSAWLRPDDDIVIERVNKRISAVTKLEMDTAEDLQIANYGIGGHYEPHFDFARKPNSVLGQVNGNRIATFLVYKEESNAFKGLNTGNRIATWLSYMSDVEAGGATVFPYIGVKIFPKRGMAAFWYNLYKNGDGIYDTRHAACPVLVGTKWVSNKWIHERGQEFRRPCGLKADD
ncbi:P4HA [Mytilus coruscus]|uniref:P4HA n=1 Tax=Mytilus coruscus TaxID=42192 RepID=A0A6J8D2T1_MYTCO|nr:P4HA [Mytilus coruscus]